MIAVLYMYVFILFKYIAYNYITLQWRKMNKNIENNEK